MKPIDTHYNGDYFRSRLEAKWAVFFYELGISYQYEPQGFKSSDGRTYLPDFYLPDTYLRDESHKGVYIEIKPKSHYSDTLHNCEYWFTGNLVLFKGVPIENIWGGGNDLQGDGGFQIVPTWDNCMFFWVCSNCGATKIEFAEGNYDYCPICDGRCNESKLFNAAKISYVKRFEHNAI